MKILHLSTYFRCAGQSVAANRLHFGLLDKADSHLVVTEALVPAGQNIHPANDRTPHGLAEDSKSLMQYPNKSGMYIFHTGIAGIDVLAKVDEFAPDIVQLHFINDGFVKLEDLPRIDKPIVWRLSDCWAMTGGCHFQNVFCKRYMAECGHCPVLSSGRADDESARVWKRKMEAYDACGNLHFVTPSKWLYDMAASSPLLGGRNIHHIPNGLDTTTEFYPEDKLAARRALGLPEDKKVILFGAVNPEHPRKGLNYLLSAIEELANPQDYHLLMFGRLDASKVSVKIPFTFAGRIFETSKLRMLYSAADVSVFPSSAESFGQVVTESMACGTPVVTFANTGPGTIVEHKVTGYVADYGDAWDLAEGIEYVVNNDMTVAARKTAVEVYDIDKVTDQYVMLYEGILSGTNYPTR